MKKPKLSPKAIFIVLTRLLTYRKYISDYYNFLFVYDDKLLTTQLLCSNIKEYGGLIIILIKLPNIINERLLSLNEIKNAYAFYSEEELISKIENLVKQYPSFNITPKEKLNTKLYNKAIDYVSNRQYRPGINYCAILLLYIEALSVFNISGQFLNSFISILNFDGFNPFTTDEGFEFWDYVVKNIQDGTT